MKIFITDDCISCGACEAVNPHVFVVDIKARINLKAADKNKDDCIDAALICPVNAIWIDDIF